MNVIRDGGRILYMSRPDWDMDQPDWDMGQPDWDMGQPYWIRGLSQLIHEHVLDVIWQNTGEVTIHQ